MPKRILVVDDEVEAVKMMKIVLEASGYEVIGAHEGQEALK